MRSRLDVGGVVRSVFQIYVDQASVLMPAAAAVFVVSGILTELLLATGSGGLTLLGLLVSLVATTLFSGMVVLLVADVRDGRRDLSASQLLGGVAPVAGRLIGVALLTGILEGLGFILLIVPGLVLFTIWAVVAPVVVIERTGVLAALARSRDLVRGNGWQVFAVILLLFVGVVAISLTLDSAAAAAGTAVGLVVRVIVGILAAPISALAAAVLYFELREREREAPHGSFLSSQDGGGYDLDRQPQDLNGHHMRQPPHATESSVIASQRSRPHLLRDLEASPGPPDRRQAGLWGSSHRMRELYFCR